MESFGGDVWVYYFMILVERVSWIMYIPIYKTAYVKYVLHFFVCQLFLITWYLLFKS